MLLVAPATEIRDMLGLVTDAFCFCMFRSCEAGLASDVATEAVGELGAWFSALVDQRPRRLSFEGDRRFARDLVAAFSEALFDELAYAR